LEYLQTQPDFITFSLREKGDLKEFEADG